MKRALVCGAEGTWRGGREKVRAAVCRKVAEVAGKTIGWRPKVFLKEGIALTYPWIEAQVKAQAAAG